MHGGRIWVEPAIGVGHPARLPLRLGRHRSRRYTALRASPRPIPNGPISCSWLLPARQLLTQPQRSRRRPVLQRSRSSARAPFAMKGDEQKEIPQNLVYRRSRRATLTLRLLRHEVRAAQSLRRYAAARSSADRWAPMPRACRAARHPAANAAMQKHALPSMRRMPTPDILVRGLLPGDRMQRRDVAPVRAVDRECGGLS
jgi:hypothetical protein